MFGRTAKPNARETEGEASEPLLNRSRDELATSDDRVVFSVHDDDDDDDDDEDEDDDGNAYTADSRLPQRVRFQEEVQVVALPLRSTMQSRETGQSITFSYGILVLT